MVNNPSQLEEKTVNVRFANEEEQKKKHEVILVEDSSDERWCSSYNFIINLNNNRHVRVTPLQRTAHEHHG